VMRIVSLFKFIEDMVPTLRRDVLYAGPCPMDRPSKYLPQFPKASSCRPINSQLNHPAPHHN
jgi:hypothetical protein